jgi:hypothetical protein
VAEAFQRLNPLAILRDAVPHFVATAPPDLKTNRRRAKAGG